MSEHKEKNQKRRSTGLVMRSVVALAVVAVLAVVGYVMVRVLADHAEAVTEVLNQAGKQRMRAQRAALLAQTLAGSPISKRETVRKYLSKVTAELENVHRRLSRGRGVAQGRRRLSPGVYAVYYERPHVLDKRMRLFLGDLHDVLRQPDQYLLRDNASVRAVVAAASTSPLFDALDAAVSERQKESDRFTSLLETLEGVNLGAILVALACTALFVMRPMAQRISSEMKNLADIGRDLEARMIERTRDVERSRAKAIKALRNLEESEARYRAVVDTAAEGIVTIDDHANIESVNDAALEIFGYRRSELLGKNVRILMPEPYHSEHDGYLSRFLRTGETRVIGTGREVEGVRKNGAVFPVEIAISETRLDYRVTFTGILRDITEKRQLERQLHQAQKLEAIGTLAGGIAHDFNNILGAIMGHADLLRDDAVTSESRESVERILRAGRRGKDLIRNILSFSRVEEQDFQSVDLRPLVREVLKLLRATLPSSIEIHERLAGQVCRIEGDPTQIMQLLMNLGTNAAQAMSAEGGRLSVSLEEISLDRPLNATHRTLAPGRYMRLCVADNGCGMDAVTIERIFEPFFTTKPPGKGTGLGLSVVHGVVERHNGVITVESKPGQGTEFSVYFPPAQRLEEADPDVFSGAREHGDERVLLVDDEPDLALLGQKMLERLGYQVDAFTHGEKALEAFRADPACYHVVVTDLTMPDVSGTRLAREVRRLRPDIPIVLTSGYAESIDEARALDLGFGAFLMKPFVGGELSAAVRKALEAEPRD